MSESVRAIQCPRCGAYLTDTPGAVSAAACQYCGTQLIIRAPAPWREVELLGLHVERIATAPLKNAVDRCLHAVHRTDAAAFGCGQLHFTGPALTMAATDGHRLAFCSHSCSLPRAQAPFLLPRRALERLLDELQTSEAFIDLAFGDDRLFVRVGTRALSFVYGTGTFPDLRRGIPKSVVSSTVIPAAPLLKALNEAPWVFLRLRGNDLVVGSETRQVQLPFSTEGQQLSVYVNPVFLQESVNACRAPSLRLGFAGAAGPVVVQPAEPNGFMAVIMPLRPPS